MHDIVLTALTIAVYIAVVVFFCETIVLILTLVINNTEVWKMLFGAGGEYWVRHSKLIYDSYKSKKHISTMRELYNWYIVTRLVTKISAAVILLVCAIALYVQSAIDWTNFWKA